eukprot:PhM_4_TR17296/c0_g1_i1/m.98581
MDSEQPIVSQVEVVAATLTTDEDTSASSNKASIAIVGLPPEASDSESLLAALGPQHRGDILDVHMLLDGDGVFLGSAVVSVTAASKDALISAISTSTEAVLSHAEAHSLNTTEVKARKYFFRKSKPN